MEDGAIVNVQVPPMPGIITVDGAHLVAVCTQCCDLDGRNTKERAGVSVAPVRKAPVGPHEHERREMLLASSTPDADQRWSWIHAFPLLLDIDGEEQLVVVDFSAVTTIGKAAKSVPKLIESKLWQMEDDTRDNFREKIAAMFGRPAED